MSCTYGGVSESYTCVEDDHPCEHECLGVDDLGYTCQCPAGFNITVDGHACRGKYMDGSLL